ncbi:hypothetical protein [Yoonia sp.]|uniref:hypothetical protein n=1 Tax=Yoonia sp. TaxID=2212373 RepID=UPI00391C3C47
MDRAAHNAGNPGPRSTARALKPILMGMRDTVGNVIRQQEAPNAYSIVKFHLSFPQITCDYREHWACGVIGCRGSQLPRLSPQLYGPDGTQA